MLKNARILAGSLGLTLLALNLVIQPACNLVRKSVEVEKLLTPLAEADTPQLIAAVNKLVGVRFVRKSTFNSRTLRSRRPASLKNTARLMARSLCSVPARFT